MAGQLRITVLAENTAGGRNLLAEHGLALWVEVDDQRLLFDTGQGAVLAHNAGHLGVPLQRTDSIVLSHGHYDHSGGLDQVLDAAPQAAVYAHPAALEPKYGRHRDGTSRDIGMPQPARSTLDDHADQWIRTVQPTEIGHGVLVTGEIPRRTEYEDTGGPFFLDRQCRQPDLLWDDQAIVIDTARGTVGLVGCSHAGIINTLEHVRELTDGRPIHAVVGGMHLATASRNRMDRTIDRLRQFDVQRLGPAHCTGPAPTAALWHAFPEKCSACAVGTRMEFELS